MSKPNPHPPFPTSKLPPSNRRPIYQSQPQPPSQSRCLRAFFCSIILALFSLILLIAIAGGILYAVYRPHTPTFSISSLRLNPTSILDIKFTARNPNRQIVYSYDQIAVSVSSNGVAIGEGSFPGFVHSAKNTTVLSSSASVKLDLRESVVALEIEMETKARIEIGRLKTKRFGMKVYCDGIQIAAPKGKKMPPASTVGWGCRVELRMKIWKWTV